MSNASDVSLAIDFMRQLAGLTDQYKIAQAGINALQQWQLDSALQLRDRRGVFSRSKKGHCSPLEESVLSHMASCDRVIDLGRRTAFNFERATIIVSNMPVDDPARYGRLKDSVILIAESLDIHMRSLDLALDAIDRGDALLRIIQRNAQVMRDIEQRLKLQRNDSANLLNHLVKDIEDSFLWLGLSERQEHYLQSLARDTVTKAQALYDNGIAVDSIIKSLGEGLDDATKSEIQSAVNASALVNMVELW